MFPGYVSKTGTNSLDSHVPYQLPEDAQQISSNTKWIQPLWINYMLNLNPLTGFGQSLTGSFE